MHEEIKSFLFYCAAPWKNAEDKSNSTEFNSIKLNLLVLPAAAKTRFSNDVDVILNATKQIKFLASFFSFIMTHIHSLVCYAVRTYFVTYEGRKNSPHYTHYFKNVFLYAYARQTDKTNGYKKKKKKLKRNERKKEMHLI